ncbi:MAG: hypothetical protein LBP80_07505 [Treponema sp.]|jgi:hypothetical protein|nr:hypothetical protein [Treponema sp.]
MEQLQLHFTLIEGQKMQEKWENRMKLHYRQNPQGKLSLFPRDISPHKEIGFYFEKEL